MPEGHRERHRRLSECRGFRFPPRVTVSVMRVEAEPSFVLQVLRVDVVLSVKDKEYNNFTRYRTRSPALRSTCAS